MNIENWKLEDNVNDWVKDYFKQLKQYKFTVESSMSEFLKVAIQEGVKLKRLELEEEEKEKSKSWVPDFELECFEIPVLIENKLGLSKLCRKNGEKLKQDIKSAKNYAVNGAIHYAQSAILSKKYKDVIAIGIAGDNSKNVQIEVYYVYGSTDETYKLMENYKTLDFLENNETFKEFYKEAVLTEEEKNIILIDSREKLQRYAKELNKLMHNHSITAPQRVLYVSGMLLAMQDLIVNGKVEKRGLIPEDLQGIDIKRKRDGDIIVDHIRSYLELKDIPVEKVDLMMASFKEINKDKDRDKKIALDSRVSKLIKEKASVNKQIFTYIYENIFKSIDSMSGHLDIMGEMYSEFLKYALGDGKEIGIVLTPPYVTKMMAEIVEVDIDSKVMDLATGSAGFLISAMEIMIDKAETKYGKNTTKAKEKIKAIKSKQLLGVELNAEMFTLASTNMILRGDGSSNIKKGSSFDEPPELYKEFKANKLLLNPPFTYSENGMPFIEFGLRNVEENGKAAIIIQDSAGNGQAINSCKEILSCNQMIASIKMPADIFMPMAGVQTSIYIFEHTKKQHDVTKQVRFIDFRNDGYKRTKRNVNEIDNPKQRYQDIVEICKNGITANVDKQLWNLEEQVVMDRITLEGNDWNFEQHKKINKIPRQDDFKKTIKDYLEWKVNTLAKEEDVLREIVSPSLNKLEEEFIKNGGSYKEVKIEDIFEVKSSKKIFHANNLTIYEEKQDNTYPYVVRSSKNNGIRGFIKENINFLNQGNTFSFAQDTFTIFYQPDSYFTGNKVKVLIPKIKFNEKIATYISTTINKTLNNYTWGVTSDFEFIKNISFIIPFKDKKVDCEFIENYITEVEKEHIKLLKEEYQKQLNKYLSITKLYGNMQ